MNRAESKYFHTAEKMDEAFLELLEQKGFSYITVKELCQRAGVNRSTFYLHYETMGDLLTESVEYLRRKAASYFQPGDSAFLERLQDCPLEELDLITPQYLLPYLRFAKEHRNLFQTALKHTATLELETSYEGLFRHVFRPILCRFHVPEGDQEYMMAFYLRGVMAVVERWLEMGCQETEEQVTRVIMRCIKH